MVIRAHFIDSLSCATSPALVPDAHLLDIGTGAGFPAIPLKIYRPDLRVTAVDAVSKKIIFVRQACRTLGLSDVECLAERVEHLHPGERSTGAGPFDVVTSRAVGSLPYLLTLAVPLLTPDGCLLLQRGPQALQELDEQAGAIHAAGLEVGRVEAFHFSWLDSPRYVVELRRLSG